MMTLHTHTHSLSLSQQGSLFPRVGYTYTSGKAAPPLQGALPGEHASGRLWSGRLVFLVC